MVTNYILKLIVNSYKNVCTVQKGNQCVFHCTQTENLDCKILTRILKSITKFGYKNGNSLLVIENYLYVHVSVRNSQDRNLPGNINSVA